MRNGPDIVVALTIRVPKNTKNVRLVEVLGAEQRIGSAEVDRKVVLEAPAAPTPEPQLIPAK